MEALRQYIISVVAAALICGIITGLFPKGAAREVMKLVCGLFLAYTVLRPMAGAELGHLEDLPFSFSSQGEAAAALGIQMAEESMAQFIKEETQAYILDKASKLGLTLEADVTLDEENIPVAVTLRGQVSPYDRSRLERMLTQDLAIAKENLQWKP